MTYFVYQFKKVISIQNKSNITYGEEDSNLEFKLTCLFEWPQCKINGLILVTMKTLVFNRLEKKLLIMSNGVGSFILWSFRSLLRKIRTFSRVMGLMESAVVFVDVLLIGRRQSNHEYFFSEKKIAKLKHWLKKTY